MAVLSVTHMNIAAKIPQYSFMQRYKPRVTCTSKRDQTMTNIVSVPHMNVGDGETSYATNSLIQKTVISKSRPVLEETIRHMLINSSLPSCLNVADLGCSSGPNTLLVISGIIDTIHEMCQQRKLRSPEFQVFLNDLSGNDFNTIFKSIPEFYKRLYKDKADNSGPCFISGLPGSFYGRLFPSRSMHLIHSSSSVNWLSQVPENLVNKGNIYMATSSSESVYKAYLVQFQRDFSMFLSLRSEEIVRGGRMIITFLGRSIPKPSIKDCCYPWQLLTTSLLELIDEGLVEKDDLDSFNLPLYSPYVEEIKEIIEREGSFKFDMVEIFDINWDPSNDVSNKNFALNKYQCGQNVAKNIRAVSEPLLASHFGESVMDPLFAKYAKHVAEHLDVEKTKFVMMVMSMTRK